MDTSSEKSVTLKKKAISYRCDMKTKCAKRKNHLHVSDQIIKLNCDCIFHEKCLRDWQMKNDLSCPNHQIDPENYTENGPKKWGDLQTEENLSESEKMDITSDTESQKSYSSIESSLLQSHRCKYCLRGKNARNFRQEDFCVIFLNCGCTFHAPCIQHWKEKNDPLSCPLHGRFDVAIQKERRFFWRDRDKILFETEKNLQHKIIEKAQQSGSKSNRKSSISSTATEKSGSCFLCRRGFKADDIDNMITISCQCTFHLNHWERWIEKNPNRCPKHGVLEKKKSDESIFGKLKGALKRIRMPPSSPLSPSLASPLPKQQSFSFESADKLCIFCRKTINENEIMLPCGCSFHKHHYESWKSKHTDEICPKHVGKCSCCDEFIYVDESIKTKCCGKIYKGIHLENFLKENPSKCHGCDNTLCFICIQFIDFDVEYEPILLSGCGHMAHSLCYLECLNEGDRKCPRCHRALGSNYNVLQIGGGFTVNDELLMLDKIANLEITKSSRCHYCYSDKYTFELDCGDFCCIKCIFTHGFNNRNQERICHRCQPMSLLYDVAKLRICIVCGEKGAEEKKLQLPCCGNYIHNKCYHECGNVDKNNVEQNSCKCGIDDENDREVFECPKCLRLGWKLKAPREIEN